MSRARVWTFITYPESMPENWKEIIEERLLVPFVMSPLHDKDLKEDGTFKKAHYHNMVMFSNVKSYKQVGELVSCLGGTVAVSQVHSTQAMIRYFVHADQKQKAQYNKKDIQSFNGADIDNLFEKNDKEIYGMLSDILEFIEDNTITEFIDLLNHCRKESLTDWFPLVSGKYSYLLTQAVNSKRFKLQKPKE